LRLIGAHHGPYLDKTPRLVDAGGPDELGPPDHRVEKCGAGAQAVVAGIGPRCACPRHGAMGRHPNWYRYRSGLTGSTPGDRFAEPRPNDRAVRTLKGVLTCVASCPPDARPAARRNRPSGSRRHLERCRSPGPTNNAPIVPYPFRMCAVPIRWYAIVVSVRGGILVGAGEISFDIGLHLAPGGRGPAGVVTHPGSSRIKWDACAARMTDRVVECGCWASSGAAQPFGAAVGIAALAV